MWDFKFCNNIAKKTTTTCMQKNAFFAIWFNSVKLNHTHKKNNYYRLKSYKNVKINNIKIPNSDQCTNMGKTNEEAMQKAIESLKDAKLLKFFEKSGFGERKISVLFFNSSLISLQ